MLLSPLLTDGVSFLRPLEVADGPAHLAGEDEEIASYLSGGNSPGPGCDFPF